MIRSHMALLRHAQDFFRSDLVGLYSWDAVKIGERELQEPLPPNLAYRDRKRAMEAREGRGKHKEQERLIFQPWEILMYSANERPPCGQVTLREFDTAATLVTGPLDAATWSKIGNWIRSHHQRKAS